MFYLLNLFFYISLIIGKKEGDDGSGDHVDIPKRTTPAKGMQVSFLTHTYKCVEMLLFLSPLIFN